MLRPATPLTILLFISFVFLVISTISTPIVRGIPLARTENVNFGVFGWTKDTGESSGVQIGWNTDEALPTNDDQNFTLTSSARHSLSSLLIVHPVAAFCNLVVLGLAIAAHFHAPSHSARYLLALLILMLPTMLVTLLAFLVDILLFVPHMAWGCWIVLASTILISASGVVTCAMRRTLVSRKARKKRIAENAEMSGENFYNRQNQESKIPAPALSTESKAPLVYGAPHSESLPPHPTFSASRPSEEASSIHPMSERPTTATSVVDGTDRYYSGPSRSSSRPRPTDFSAPLGVAQPLNDRTGPVPYSSRGNDPYSGRGSRGRGNPRGGYAYRGPPPPPGSYGRGGYPGRGRGAFPPGRGGYGGNPMSPDGAGRYGGPPVNRRQPPPGYPPEDGQTSPSRYGPPDETATSLRGAELDGTPYVQDHDLPQGSSNFDSPDQVANPAYGSRAQSPAHSRRSPYGSRRQSPSGGPRQQSLPPPPMPPMPVNRGADMHYGDGSSYMPGSNYNSDSRDMADLPSNTIRMPEPQRQGQQQDSYIPARAGWTNNHHATTIPDGYSQRSPQRPMQNKKRMSSGGSDYYEDVNDRFQSQPVPAAAAQSYQPELHGLPSGQHPNSLNPESILPLPLSHSYEDLPGARSPAESETSNFTSISQRQPNINYRPGYGGEFHHLGPAGRPPPQRHDVILAGNPDFELPGMGPRGRGGMRNRGGMISGVGRPPVMLGPGSESRYPNPPPPGPGSMREV